MIFDIIILIMLLYGLLSGLMRGGVLQLFSLIGFIIALIVARLFSPDLADIMRSIISTDNDTWSLLYNVISFMLIFILVQLIIKKLANLLNIVTKLPVIGFFNRILGAILGFVQMYLVAFVVVIILFLSPMEDIKELIEESQVAMYMINSTPVISEYFKNMWFN
ncbi:MAG TPA: CvpA family protein [Pseudogracilibacillus sp.]|nr:CvpA family protein [Pseudogracilibacillus sp.]